MAEWLLITVLPRTEEMMLEDMKANGIDCYCPMMPRLTKPKGKHKPVLTKHPAFPGYSFVLKDDYPKLADANVRGYGGLILFLTGPATVTGAVVERVRAKERDWFAAMEQDPTKVEAELVKARDITFEPKAVVEFVAGVFEGVRAKVLRCGWDWVEIELLSGGMALKVPKTMVVVA
jgi:transcription antitermination factor NusG